MMISPPSSCAKPRGRGSVSKKWSTPPCAVASPKSSWPRHEKRWLPDLTISDLSQGSIWTNSTSFPMSSRQGLGPRNQVPLLDSARHQSTGSRAPSGFSRSPAGPHLVGWVPRGYRRSWPSVDHHPRIYPYHHSPWNSDSPLLARGRLLAYRGVALPAPYSYPHPRRGPFLTPTKKPKIARYRWQSNHRCPPRHPRHRTWLHSLLHRCRFHTLPRSQMDESPASIALIYFSRQVR